MPEIKSMVGEVYLAYRTKTLERTKIGKSEDVYHYAMEKWDDTLCINEKMLVIFLNRASVIIGYNWHSQGVTHGTLIDRKIITKLALDLLSDGVILVHNHPSGNTEPSNADLSMTKDVRDALEYMSIDLLDHLIISQTRYYSFADEGKIPGI